MHAKNNSLVNFQGKLYLLLIGTTALSLVRFNSVLYIIHIIVSLVSHVL